MRAAVVFLTLTVVLFVCNVGATIKDADTYDDEYGADEYEDDPYPKYYSSYMPSESGLDEFSR